MQIVCPNCQTSYEVAAGSLGDAGRSVRCVRCRKIWFAAADSEPDAPAGVSAAIVSAQYQKGAVGASGEAPLDATPLDFSGGAAGVAPTGGARPAGRLPHSLDDSTELDTQPMEDDALAAYN